MLHYLHIAVTALSLTACVLLVALWVRSYWWRDRVTGQSYILGAVYLWSHDGQLSCVSDRNRVLPHWEIDTNYYSRAHHMEFFFPWGWATKKRVIAIAFPHWFAVFLFALIAIAPWLRLARRFSLRTLLIATTLVAVALGMVVVS
jgi:hypothetical protein